MQRQRYVTKLLMQQYVNPKKDNSFETLPVRFDYKGKPIFNRDLIRSFEFAINDTVMVRMWRLFIWINQLLEKLLYVKACKTLLLR